MTYKHLYKVSDNSLVITLPNDFKDRQVMVTIVAVGNTAQDKMAAMMQAVKDPLYLSDLKEVNADFESIEHESL